MKDKSTAHRAPSEVNSDLSTTVPNSDASVRTQQDCDHRAPWTMPDARGTAQPGAGRRISFNPDHDELIHFPLDPDEREMVLSNRDRSVRQERCCVIDDMDDEVEDVRETCSLM